MSNNTTKRDIRHEMADVIALLGDGYTTTNVECDPGDTAIKITRQNNDKSYTSSPTAIQPTPNCDCTTKTTR